MADLGDVLIRLFSEVAEIKRQMDGLVMRGPVHSVDPKAGTVRLKLGNDDDGQPFLSPPIPYSQNMGALKAHFPPSVGQQMMAIAAAGDYRQAMAIPMTQSDANKSPSEKGDENVVTFGQFRFDLKSGELKVTIPKLILDIGGSIVEITPGMFKVPEAMRLDHAGKNVGKDHVHGGVVRGGDDTFDPKA